MRAMIIMSDGTRVELEQNIDEELGVLYLTPMRPVVLETGETMTLDLCPEEDPE